MKRHGFTMIELVFVIVIVGVLASIAASKLNFGRSDAELVNARTQIAAINSAITLKYNEKVLTGKPAYPNTLDGDDGLLFSGVLTIGGIREGNSKRGWVKLQDNKYKFSLDGQSTTYTYYPESGLFVCDDSYLCNQLK
ncbi:hypothetical protein LMG7974_00010 [Campylobacter majalis]|uniref:Type II secretion system protein n=1 Tax=Campylobacter majalis TaxID=2790656 RepID=A0ABN7K2D7_9BACT|nr:type II secretion system protein [Campylobacter majalis]CAD7286640.1 hypothetical protein LMG7974_00010 [Campylobacter majalis]